MSTAAPEAPRDAQVAGVRLDCPNPFRPQAAARVTLAQAGDVRVAVHDAAGRRVRVLADGPWAAGEHALAWDGRDAEGVPVASGVYLVRATRGGESVTAKITLVR
jgi:flagellar hook assembly protein FlgD